jgi:hypothetical protein
MSAKNPSTHSVLQFRKILDKIRISGLGLYCSAGLLGSNEVLCVGQAWIGHYLKKQLQQMPSTIRSSQGSPGRRLIKRKLSMGWLPRAIGVLFSMVIAVGVGLAFLPVALLIDPTTRDASFALIQFGLLALSEADFEGSLSADQLIVLPRLAWTAVMAICVVPLIAVASIGEIARVRSLFWYAGATGFIAASAPWILREMLHLHRATNASPAELRFALVFFVSGLVSGSVYWLLACRHLGRPAAN